MLLFQLEVMDLRQRVSHSSSHNGATCEPIVLCSSYILNRATFFWSFVISPFLSIPVNAHTPA